MSAAYDPLEDLRQQVSRHEKDLYRGNGKPSLTERMRVVEDGLKSIEKNLGKITWLTVAVLLTVIGEVLVKLVH